MAYRGKVLVVVVTVFLGLVAEQQVTFVNGDGQLIMSTCVEATKLVPCSRCDLTLEKACNECLTSTPGSINMDLIGLGRAALDCVSSANHETLDLAFKTAPKSDDHVFLPPFSSCISQLTSGGLEIGDAVTDWEEGRHADAVTHVQAGARDANDCSDELEKYKVYDDLVNEIVTLQLLRDAVVGVLRQIH